MNWLDSFMDYPLIPWIKFTCQLMGTFCQVGLVVLGAWALYLICTEPVDVEDIMELQENLSEESPTEPFYVRAIMFLFFWPNELLLNNRFVAPYFENKTSIIILLPMMFVLPWLFWGFVVAMVIAGLTATGVIH